MSLFRDIWNAHTEIREYSAKSHPVCDECGEFGARLDRLGEGTDSASVKERAVILKGQARLASAAPNSTF
eukprot:2738855-Pleurochrysis_carterae.AAC.1